MLLLGLEITGVGDEMSSSRSLGSSQAPNEAHGAGEFPCKIFTSTRTGPSNATCTFPVTGNLASFLIPYPASAGGEEPALVGLVTAIPVSTEDGAPGPREVVYRANIHSLILFPILLNHHHQQTPSHC